jgi:hypothetical protein
MVDGAVVMVENAYRIMAERRAHGERVDRTSAVLAAAHEVANPIAFAILIIIVVFLPLFSLEGLEGKLFKPMAFNIAFAMAGSLILSLTLIPVLAAMILKPGEEKDTRLVAFIKARYRPLLNAALAHKRSVVGGAAAALVLSLALFPLLGKEFMPQLQEGSIMWRVTGIPSTSLDESIRTSRSIAEAFKKFPEVETTLAMIGRAEKGETADVNYMEIYTALHPEDEWTTGRSLKDLEEAMEETLEQAVPNVVPGYTQPIQMRVEELISGVRATLALKLYGEDLVELDRLPLTFLTGVLLDDEGAITVMDWDRILSRWRSLDAEDDGLRFDIVGLQHVPAGTPRVALAVTGSYAVDVARIGEAIPEMPLVEMRLREGSTDAHWSEAKQQALGKQFLNTVIALANLGVSDLHLFLAAQNSLVFSFGRLYDKRNLPRVTVYQYEKGNDVAFPWGIRMPVAGQSAAEVIRTPTCSG